MSRVNYVVVFSSPKYRELIYSSLSKNEMVFQEPVKEDEKFLSEYVKNGTLEIGHYDSFVIDLGSLKDTDSQIIEAIEAIRYLDDKVRIIILEGTRQGCENLFNKFFLNGIYNLICAEDYIKTKQNLEKCLLEGMSYKDALEFKEVNFKKNKKQEIAGPQEFVSRRVAFSGSQRRIGTTHCVLVAAFTLRKNGYLVAVVDKTGSRDYLELMHSYEQQLSQGGSFTIDNIDFYVNTENALTEEELKKNAYNFVLYDLGTYSEEPENYETFLNVDERLLVIGSKPWELPWVAKVLSELQIEGIKYLFNFPNHGLAKELRKLMKDAGIKQDVYFMEYLEDYFSVSGVMKDVFQVIPQKSKKGLFRRK